VLRNGLKAARVLFVRGTVWIDILEGIAPGYAAMIRRTEREEPAEALLTEWPLPVSVHDAHLYPSGLGWDTGR
jgi:hypothetical protein